MRKYLILTILLSCLHIAARGQTITSLDDIDLSGLPQPTQAKELRYWFDEDATSVQTTQQLSGQHSLDVSSLAEGLHTIHITIVDNQQMLSPTTSSIFLRLVSNTTGNAKVLRYWFDNDANSQTTISSISGTHTIDANALSDGLHILHVQLINGDDEACYTTSGFFLKDGGTGIAVTAKKVLYWFDDEENIKVVDVVKGVQMLDASGLIDGLHTLHYQVLCSNGEMTTAMSSIFMRLSNDASNTAANALRYWFDDEQSQTEVSISEGIQTIDASRLLEGLHTIHYQVIDAQGMAGTLASSMFMKMDASLSETKVKSLRYWFDDDATSLKVIAIGNGTQTLDVSALQMGIHTLHYQLIDSNGKIGTPVTGFFMKNFVKVIEGGENLIKECQYWLNDNCQNIQTVTLDKAANPYTLISLLPMQKEPIHSQHFHFEITNGQPTVYAKNEFYVRFHDAMGYFVDDSRMFVDYSVKQTLTNFELLNPGDHKDTARPAGNEIKWYSLTAEPGDSVQFRLDRAATLQLFSPSGTELLSTSGYEAVNWFGCHVRENGTYYVALHDVTAQQGTTISIDYNHIDKYAVLRQDVAMVGNGGCSTITFEGNGFLDLYDVMLFNEKGDTIPQLYIGHESNATTSVVFDFTDTVLGTYHAKFRFTEEDKVFNSLVTVEEARNIELATTVTYPSTFLRGTSTTYTIKITNTGNMTAYYVPVYTYIKSPTEDAIIHIDYDGLDLPGIYSQVDLSELSSAELQKLYETEKQLGALPYFVSLKVPVENNIALDSTIVLTGTSRALNKAAERNSMYIRTGLFFVDIAPNSTKELKLIIQTNEIVEAWITTPENWVLFGHQSNEASRKTGFEKISPIEGAFCCYRDIIECILEVKSAVCDITSFVLALLGSGTEGTTALVGLAVALEGCKTTFDNNRLKGFGNALCNSDKENIKERILEGLIASARSAINIPAIISCVGAALSGASALKLTSGSIANILEKVSKLLSGGSFISDVMSLFGDLSCKTITSSKPGCPPTPPKGGSSTPVVSIDPNDIFGYTAESGSHAVKDGLTSVYYRIEFENDTAFATASAHDIFVTDTLDVTKFDLSTFAPTRVKIGEKSAELTGDKNYVTTIDMRPSINAIAQVEGTFDEQKGIAKWHISSLDPMTMEPTKYVMDGVLPVNTDGRGIGELSYDISLKPSLAHGTEINNRAGIVFDTNDVIMTPTWTNTIDRIAPESRITNIQVVNDSTAAITITAGDDGSGPWRYDVYVQYGENAPWWKMAENVPADSIANVKIYEGVDHGFYVVATDMAGNVEVKEAVREFSLTVGTTKLRGDVNCDGAVNIADVAAVLNIMAGNTTGEGDVNGDGAVNIADVAAVLNIMAGN